MNIRAEGEWEQRDGNPKEKNKRKFLELKNAIY